MISQSGVVWNREQNYVYASPAQWALWRELYPMARAYMTQGDPLYTELKSLFAPDDVPPDGPLDEDELIVIMDSDDEDFPPLPLPIVHALPALDQHDFNQVILPDPPVAEVVVISSDDDSDDDMYGYFDSDVELDFSDDENHIPVLMIEEAIGEVVDPMPIRTAATNTQLEALHDVPGSPNADLPIPSASLAAIRAAIRTIPYFRLRDYFTSSDEEFD
ncbi:hypothetical protein ACS0TY_008339 [Phlomoides rotata]